LFDKQDDVRTIECKKKKKTKITDYFTASFHTHGTKIKRKTLAMSYVLVKAPTVTPNASSTV
jgi:hypothetical protein